MNDRVMRMQEDYAIRLERVVAWLADHLDDALDVPRLADVASMSPFHFHRIYHAMQGETTGDTVRRLRLHRAAVEFITGERPVNRVRAGPGTAVSRRSRERSGPPTACLLRSTDPRSCRCPGSQEIHNEMKTMVYRRRFEIIPPIRVAALDHCGDYQTITTAFQRLSTIAAGQGAASVQQRACSASITTIHRSRHMTRCDRRRCISVPDGWTPGWRAYSSTRSAAGGTSVALHVGPYAELQHRGIRGFMEPGCPRAERRPPSCAVHRGVPERRSNCASSGKADGDLAAARLVFDRVRAPRRRRRIADCDFRLEPRFRALSQDLSPTHIAAPSPD